MNREIQKLCEHEYDILIIGGGITGAVAAWDAAMRGLSVALIEKSDFGGATSAASGKIIHGGLRYLQHADCTVCASLYTNGTYGRRGAAYASAHPLPCADLPKSHGGPTVLHIA
jgi:glycerol-3-phosphate dehydrogenase